MSEDEAVRDRLLKVQWSRDQEELLAEWSDKAACYRWMHDRTEKKFSRLNTAITIPVIILSTLSGTANFGLTSIFPPEMSSVATLCIGAVSLITGIISTIGNFLRYAQGMESHRVASISWGKLQRKIAVELALSPHLRSDSMDFLKICRAEMDRLIEQSPGVPDEIISRFVRTFKKATDVKKPDICDEIEHTHIYKLQANHIAAITARAASLLRSRGNDELFPPQMRQEVAQEVTKRTDEVKHRVRSGILKAAKMESQRLMTTNPLHKNDELIPIPTTTVNKNDESVSVPTIPEDSVSIRIEPLQK